MNTITGTPVNLAITPDQHLALVANSLDRVKDGEAWKGVPDNKIYVIDLTTSPPQQIGTVEAGKQASGMAINHAGTLALVANRAEDSVTVLAIEGKNVKSVGTVSVSTQPTPAVAAPPAGLPVAVAITPDGKHALVAKSGANRVGLLEIDGQKVSYAQVDGKNYDMATGLNPLNVQITPDGKLAVVNNIGGGQDGQVGTPKTAFYRHDKSYVALLKIEGKTVRKVGQTDVGGLAEGIVFSPDGRYLYVGNFVDGNMDILRLDGDTLTKVANFALPGIRPRCAEARPEPAGGNRHERNPKSGVVTGAAGGIGRAQVRGLLSAGIQVAGADRDREPLEALAASGREQGKADDLRTIQTDLTSDAAIEEITKATGGNAPTTWPTCFEYIYSYNSGEKQDR